MLFDLLSYLDTIYFDNTHWMNGNSTHPINKEHSRYVWFETEITVDWLEFNSDTSTLFLRSTKNSYGQFLTVSKASILARMNQYGANHIIATDETLLVFEDGLFSNFKTLKTVDLHAAHRSSGTSMDNWFSGCTNLEKVKLSGMDTSFVESMFATFYYCEHQLYV